MNPMHFSKVPTRREILRATSALAGGALLAECLPWKTLAKAPATAWAQNAQAPGSAPVDPVVKYRTGMATIPVQTTKLRDKMYLLSGPGGNIIVLDGADGKLMVD